MGFLSKLQKKINPDRIGTKLVIGNTGILIVIVCIVVISAINFYQAKASLNETNDSYVPQINYANAIKEAVVRQQVEVQAFINSPSLAHKNAYREQDRIFNDAYQQLQKLAHTSDLEILEQKVKHDHDNFSLIANNIFRSIDSNRTLASNKLLDNYNISVGQVVKASTQLAEHTDKELTQSIAYSNQKLTISLYIMLLLTCLAFVIATILTFGLISSITSPMNKMIHITKEISRGDLRKRVNIHDQGEVGELAGAFDFMVDNLSALIQEVLVAGEYIVRVSDDFIRQANDSALDSDAAGSAIKAVMDKAKYQSETVSSILESVNNVAAGINQIDATIKGVNERNSRTTQLAASGKESVDEGFRQMRTIQETMKSLYQTVNDLTTRLSDISKMVDLMEDFAEQTNMLAINAAIEASKVGESGKGFAVVAHEIRKLADESTKSAERIRNTIVEIQAKSKNTVKTMQESNQVVESGTQSMETVGKSLKEIIGFVDRSVMEIHELVYVSDNIAQNSKVIVQDVTDLEGIAKDTATHSNTLGRVIRKQAEAITEAAASLEEIATTLEHSTGRFLIADGKGKIA